MTDSAFRGDLASDAPALSVIIVSYKCADLLDQCLQSLEKEPEIGKTEIIVVDNASGDGTVERVRQAHREVRLIANAENVGFPVANNQALAVARGRHVLLLNPDTLVTHGAIRALLDFFSEPPQAKLVGLRLSNPDGSLQEIGYVRLPTKLQFIKEQLRRSGSRLTDVEIDRLRAAAVPQQVASVSGAAMAFGRNVLERLGYLDTTMFWAEDLDYCYRAMRAGIPVYFLPRAEVIHYGGESGKKNLRRMIYAQHASRVDFARKHYGRLTELVVRSVFAVMLPAKMLRRLLDVPIRARREAAAERLAGYRDAFTYCIARIPPKTR